MSTIPHRARLRLAASCVLLAVLLSLVLDGGGAEAQTPVAAPTIESITPADGSLSVAWTAPTGVTGISAYDLRHIRSDAPDKADADWTEIEDIWTSGSGDLTYTLGGLDNGVGYDVQLRTVTTTDGAWSGTSTGTPRIPGPVITSVVTGDGALTVVWTAPAGVTGITAYDLRYIATADDETSDANWTVVAGFWASGGLQGVLAGLTNTTGYDVQVRAVAATDGAWSATSAGTPAEHGGTTATATTLTLGRPLGGTIDPGTDEDYFQLVLSSAATILIRTSGDLDTVGELQDSGGTELESNNDGRLPQSPKNFVIWRVASAGTYYVKVSSNNDATGAYVLHAIAIADSTARSDAVTVTPDSSTLALADHSRDTDYFELTLAETTELVIRTSGPIHDTEIEILDNSAAQIAENDYGLLPPRGQHAAVRASLGAGTYFIKVRSQSAHNTGPYTLHVDALAEPGDATTDAVPLELHHAAGGNIDPASDVDFFRIDLSETTHVRLRAVSETVDIDGSLLDSGGQPIQANIYEETLLSGEAMAFTFRATLSAGTYYIKVNRSGGADTGPYTILLVDDANLERLLDQCSGLDTTVSDPLYGCQWNLKNTGQFGGTAGEDINVEPVWNGGNLGAGINVVIVDTYLDHRHEDLTTDQSRSHEYHTRSGYSTFLHSTEVAGIVAARDNSLGVKGVAPRATLIEHAGVGLSISIGPNPDKPDAMTRNMDVAAVSNNSWSGSLGPGPLVAPDAWETALQTGVTEGYGGKGVFYVFSSGNQAQSGSNANLDEHINLRHVTVVCAVNDLGQRSAYSEGGANLWVCAPSDDPTRDRPGIFTTAGYSAYTDSFGGTSAAAPTVSGVAALVRAANASLTWRDVKLILAASARKNDATNTGWEQGALEYGSGTLRYDFNHEYGFGVVDAGAAVTLADGWTNLPPYTDVTVEWDGASVVIPDLTDPDVPLGITWTMAVGPEVEFTEFVEVNLEFVAVSSGLDVPQFRELDVTLESPSGAVSVLAPAVTDGVTCSVEGSCGLEGGLRLGSARHLGENPEGAWKLRVFDRVTGSTPGTLKSWSLTVYGHRSTPAAPAIDSVTAGSESLTVTWTAPTNTGASDITAYDVRSIRSDATDMSDSEWTVVDDAWTSGDLDYTISGLTGNVQYDVEVRAVNASGDGLWSATGAGTPTTDKAPTIDSVTPGDRSITVEWTAPTNATLGTITSYDLRHIRSDAPDKADARWTVISSIWTSGSLEYTLNPTPGLVNGASYDVQVRAVVGTDQQPWSGVRSATPRTTPGAPAIDAVTPGDGSLTVEWSPPQSDGGADITSYDVRRIRSDAADKSDDQWTVVDDAWSFASGALEYTVSGLTTDVQYDVQVRAANDAGDGLWSATGTGTPRTPPEAPEAVQVYVYVTGKLEVRWSAAASASITGFKVQWRSGEQEWDTSRSAEVDPTTAHVEWSSTQEGRRYRHALDGLTNGAEYELRVLASNQGVDGKPSAVATGTPQSDSTHDQAADFIENELISVYEGANPWLRVAFDWIDAASTDGDPYGQRSGIEFELGEQYWGQVVHSCFNGAGVKLHDRYWDRWARYCHITWLYIEWDYIDVIPLITHELAHVLTLTNRLDGAPEVPMAIARLHIARTNIGCESWLPARELLADLLMVATLGEGAYNQAGYLAGDYCQGDGWRPALEVVRTAAIDGEIPQWLYDTYQDQHGVLDLELLWSHIKAEAGTGPVMRDLMRSAFGGLCRSDALWNNAIRIPWRDGGCVPQAPPGLTAVPAVDGVMALAWESPDDDGGSRITGYKVQWKSGAQNYDTSREASLTDLADLSHTLEGLSHGVDYTIRILAYNINGDGAASEVTQTAVGSEAALESLTLAGTTLYPTFSSTTPSYAATTGHAATQLTIAATAADADAGVAFLDVDGNALTDAGAADEFQVNLSVGANVIQVRVTAQDGVAAIYTVTVTRAEENTSLSPPASDPVAASPSSARYTITFQGSWTTDVTPGGLPGGAHFSPLIGAVHGAGVTFLVSGGAASAGVESMAEVGQTSQLRSEVNTAIDASPATALAVISRSGNIGPTGSRALSNVELTTAFPRVTLTTMIAPSHDWFVGVSGFPLLNDQGKWLKWVRVFLYPWDAGTEEGNDFSLSPSVDTSPRGVIHSIRATGKFTTRRIASLTFTLQSVRTERRLVENTPEGVDIGPPVAAATSSGTVSYTLGGSAAASFDLDTSTGQLRTKTGVTYDHERKDSYTVTVTATDSDGSIVTTVDIAVENIDEPPLISGPTSIEFAENRSATVATYRASDPEGQAVTWALGGTGADAFRLSASGALTFRAPPDYEAQAEYELILRASADGELGVQTGTLAVTVTVTNVDEPADISFAASGAVSVNDNALAVDENHDGALATFSASDPEQKPGLTYTWSLGGSDRGDFAITGAGVLSFANVPDYERPADTGGNNVYGITVNARDSDGKTGSIALTVTVDPVNEPPAISGDVAPSIEEGGAVLVGTYRASDPESATIAWQPLAGSDSDEFDFTSSNGRLTFKTAPDFEDPERGGDNVYDVTLSASDGAHTITFDVAVSVTNREEPGMLALPATRPQAEADYSATLSDPDRVQSATWTWERSTSRSGPWAAVSGAADSTTTSVYTPVAGDVGYYLRATAAYTDGHGPNKRLVAVSTNSVLAAPVVNNPPTFEEANPTRSIAENARASAPVGERVTATDPDQGNTVGYEFDPASDLFTIDGATGQIRVKEAASLDHETAPSHTVTVKASDSSNAFDTVEVTITVTDVNEPPDAVADTSTVSEDGAVTIDVLANDSDPEDERSELLLTVVTAPLNGRASVNEPTNVGDRRTITYEPHADYHGADTFTYRARDTASPSLSHTATVSVQVDPVNDPPTFASPTTTRSVSESAEAGDNVGAPVTATDIDENDTLTYSLSGPDAFSFVIDDDGQIAVGTGVTFDAATMSEYAVTVEARDRAGAPASIDVTISVTAGPVISGGGFVGGGGGGGPSGPTPSEVDFEWTVDRDIEELDSGHEKPSGSWSDGVTLWLLENGDGADDAIYAYDLESGERVEDREFDLDDTNRAPRGVWSDRTTIWVSDSGRDKLFAHDIATGERTPERDIEFAERNADPRGIWSDGETVWVLDGRRDALFIYDLESGALLGECTLDPANDDPRGIWSDRSTVWVSNHDPKRLFAYRLPTRAEPDAAAEDKALERVRDEEFGELSKAGNNSPRGLWSDGDVMYVADENDGKVYSYNMPDGIDARLASLALSGVEIGEFDGDVSEYEGVPGDGVSETTVAAKVAQDGATVAIDPPDGDEETEGHQVALADIEEITVTVSSADESRTQTYRVSLAEAVEAGPSLSCLSGAVDIGFSLVVYEGGSVDDLVGCAQGRHVTALYALSDGEYLPYIVGAPEFATARFRTLFADGVPALLPLVVRSEGPATPAPPAPPVTEPWLVCLRGEIGEGFSLVVYEGGSVADLETCARSLGVTAVYALIEGEYVPYILGAPEFATASFRALFPDGVPAATPLTVRAEGP